MSNLQSRHYSVLARSQARSRGIPARPQSVSAPNPERPLSVAWAEALLYVATVFWLFRLLLEVHNGTPVQSLLIPAILLAVQLMLIPAATRGRSRLLLTCLIVFCLGFFLLDLLAQAIESRAHRWEPPRMRFGILRIMQFSLEAVAFALLLGGRRWFGPAFKKSR